jgi:pyrophosphatase PpaX
VTLRPYPIRALLLDLDGTVADTHHLIHRCLDETLNEQVGVRFTQEWWEAGVGKPLHKLFAHALEQHDRRDVPMEGLVDSYRARLKSYEPEVAAFPGMVNTLGLLKERGVRLSIVTTKHAEAASRHLQTLGIEAMFDVVMTGDQCANYKPDPEAFVKTVELMRLTPEDCVAVGDSPGDIIGARDAGVYAVGACWGTVNRKALMDAEPDVVIERPSDLLTLCRF